MAAIEALSDSVDTVDGIVAELEVLEGQVYAAVIDADDAPELLAKVRELLAEVGTYIEDLEDTDELTLAVIVDASNSLALWRWRTSQRTLMIDFLSQVVEMERLLLTIVSGIEERLVVVRQGETLQSIAARELGDWREWRRLLDRNPGLSPVSIDPGTTIVIPTVS